MTNPRANEEVSYIIYTATITHTNNQTPTPPMDFKERAISYTKYFEGKLPIF